MYCVQPVDIYLKVFVDNLATACHTVGMKTKHRTVRIDEEIDAAIFALMKRERRSWSSATNYLLALALRKINVTRGAK